MSHKRKQELWPWWTIGAVLIVTVFLLRTQGRLWLCSCGYFLFWTGDAWSSDTSQHLFDPYAFTHLLHGFIFCGLLALMRLRLSWTWQLSLAIAAEAAWEVIENSSYVINRYREATAALGYQGDTIVNSLGDVVACAAGFALAHKLGFGRALAVFFAVELMLLVWIRDGLLLNIVMLIFPIEAIREWQAAMVK
jgi:hypothetical protein